MNTIITQRKANTGISLLEALIALAVLSFGLLAIATFQGKLVAGSGYNKTRSEAMALAQQKLDDFRGYTTEEELVSKLKDQASVQGEVFPEHAFGDSPTLANDVVVTECDFTVANPPYTTVTDAINPIEGTNAEYTRTWKYCRDKDELLYAVVEVSWTDLQGNTDSVSLKSDLTWKNPAASVQLADIPAEPQVASATGRAYLGDGSVTDQQIADAQQNGAYEDNQDGTFSLYKANDGSDVALVDADTHEIVLTLEDACKTQDPADCYTFVKIKGRVYFNRNADHSSDKVTGLTGESVYVLASDAAYCARVFDTDGSLFSVTALDGGDPDYEYYDYTCYLGGGWYGNIGLLLTGNNVSDNDRVCLGDPNATTSGNDEWKRQELAKRRVYRGMVYVRSPDNYNEWVIDHAGNTAPVDDLANPPLYYSKGIGDGVEYPGTFYPGRTATHDFVVMRSTGQANADDCTTPLTRPDSAVADINGDGVNDLGTLFSGMPSDFICFNDEYYGGDVTQEALYDATNPYKDDENDPPFRNYPYLDRFNGETVDIIGNVAPLDTTATVYGAEGSCPWDPSRPPSNMWLLSGTVRNITTSGAYDLEGTKLTTSDGPDDCWFVDGSGNKVTNPTGTELNYICRVFEWGDGWTGQVNLEFANMPPVECDAELHDYTTAVTADQATTFEDFSCQNLAKMTITGSMTAYMNDFASGTGTQVNAIRSNADGSTTTTACTVNTTGTTATYTCEVHEESLGGGWLGRVVATTPDGFSCDTSEKVYSTALTTNDVAFETMCRGPVTTLTITATLNADGDWINTIPAVSTSTDGACVRTGSTSTTATYECTVQFNYLTGWTGSVNVSSTSTASCTPSSQSVGPVTSNSSAAAISCVIKDVATVRVVVIDGVTPTVQGDYYLTGERGLFDPSGNLVNGCSWIWHNYPDRYDTEFVCTTPAMSSGQTWDGLFAAMATSSYKICPSEVFPLTGLQPGGDYTYEVKTVPVSVPCP